LWIAAALRTTVVGASHYLPLVAATGRTLGATVVFTDDDLLHLESRRVVSVDGYR
jgi:hypothetical protein